MTPSEIHNRNAPLIVKAIIKPMLEAGGDLTDIMVMLETVMAGVLLFAVKDGGDERVISVMAESVKERLAEMRAAKRPENN
jgi:hypothetical protein